MNFERGLKPTEALDIGKVHTAPEIQSFYILDPANMVESPNGKLEPMKTMMTPLGAEEHLKDIKNGDPRRKLRFYSFHDENDNYKRLSEMKGLYVKFDGVSYKIPE